METQNIVQELSKNYPILNILVPLIVTYVMARADVRKHFKKSADNRKEDLEYRAAHEVADMTFKSEQVKQFSKLTDSVNDLSISLKTSMEKTDIRFEKLQKEIIDIQQKQLSVDTRLQAFAPMPTIQEIEVLRERIHKEIEQQNNEDKNEN